MLQIPYGHFSNITIILRDIKITIDGVHNMKLNKLGFVLLSLCLAGFSLNGVAEDKVKAEDLVEAPVEGKKAADLSKLRKAKVTEEQAVNQMKYMMVKGWARIEADLQEHGMFDPIGLLLNPQGEFKPLVMGKESNLTPELSFVAITRNLEAMAQARTLWGVGVMYVREYEMENGDKVKRINVLTEHIAGWARHWSYPFKVVEGDVKLGQPIEKSIAPFYFAERK